MLFDSDLGRNMVKWGVVAGHVVVPPSAPDPTMSCRSAAPQCLTPGLTIYLSNSCV